MGLKEKIEKLKSYHQSRINADSSEEELKEINGMIQDLNDIEEEANKLTIENGKFRDTIVRMVSSSGDSKPPVDEEGSKPKSLAEMMESEINKGEKK